jgi:pilus assembly protein Flp/PilA
MLLNLYVRVQNRLAELRNEEGATAVEYGIMVALIAAVIVGIVGTLGGQVKTAFTTVSNALP